MGERSPEFLPESREVHEDMQPPSLRDEILAMFPEGCASLKVGPVERRGQVCQTLGAVVSRIMLDSPTDAGAKERAATVAKDWTYDCTGAKSRHGFPEFLICGAWYEL